MDNVLEWQRGFGLSLLLLACNGHGGDDGFDAASMSMGMEMEMEMTEQQCESARAEVLDFCLAPHAISIIQGPERRMVIDIAESAEALDAASRTSAVRHPRHRLGNAGERSAGAGERSATPANAPQGPANAPQRRRTPLGVRCAALGDGR